MSTREYTVELRPDVGSSRAASWHPKAGVPDDFWIGAAGSGSIVSVELVKIVGGYRHGEYGIGEGVFVQILVGDQAYGTFETHSDIDVRGMLMTVVEARQGWGAVGGFWYGGSWRHGPDSDSVQREGTNRHLVVRVSSRPA